MVIKMMKRRKTSEMWNYFTALTEERAKCGICQQVFSYKSSVTNLRKHLQTRHPTVTVPSKEHVFHVSGDNNTEITLYEVRSDGENVEEVRSSEEEPQHITEDLSQAVEDPSQSVQEEETDTNKEKEIQQVAPKSYKRKIDTRTVIVERERRKKDDMFEKEYGFSNETDDDESIFGAFVASTLRGLKSTFLRKRLKCNIQRLILETSEEDLRNIYGDAVTNGFAVSTE